MFLFLESHFMKFQFALVSLVSCVILSSVVVSLPARAQQPAHWPLPEGGFIELVRAASGWVVRKSRVVGGAVGTVVDQIPVTAGGATSFLRCAGSAAYDCFEVGSLDAEVQSQYFEKRADSCFNMGQFGPGF